MSITLQVDNFGPNNIKEQSRLALAVAKGALNLKPENRQGYGNGDFLLISRPGKEICELRTVALNADGETIDVSALSFDHQRFAQLTSINGTHIKVYRAANVDGHVPADGSFVAVGSPLAIEVDQMFTNFTDPDGGAGYWYKFTYYNPSAVSETPLADAVAVRGGGYGHYATIDQIKREAGFGSNPNITPAMVDERRVNAEDEINTTLGGIYAVPFADPVPAVINNITRLLAAGFLLQNQYGVFTNASSVGDKKVKDARALLAQVKSGAITLQDATGTSIKQQQSVDIYPGNSTDDDGFMFERTMEF